ncbi:UbiX family flavin prenyltransferase [Mariniblastus fucicola]|uniref:Flavin prenyltransferase UbiX n=1 Tax=Mariniblastus fucicola TaxID=980251 RepID=A0A5B9P6D9_9BACT|nr:flavin prenyltransferase UbiX [Mariniblastus fucicola]QEG20490.1 putative aromatic acid decarboxylase [Mariniblastus fucicola]
MSNHPIVLAITGASGVIYGRRLLEILLRSNLEVHLTISESGQKVLQHELMSKVDIENFQLDQLLDPAVIEEHSIDDSLVSYHHYKDFMTPIASGSFQTRAMIVCPCSGSTLSGIATASSGNLVQRAADVHLKERRPLVLVPREAPLSLIQIENMRTVTLAGATILPASPGFYHGYKSVEDLVDFIVVRILDNIGIDSDLMKRWGS